VYKSGNASSALSHGGRLALPLGTITQETDVSVKSSEFQLITEEAFSARQIASEVIIPPANAIPFKLKERLIPISELDPLAAGCFPVSALRGQADHQAKG
jgi:antiviral helicase SLH1